MVCNKSRENVAASNGGADAAGSLMNCACVTARGGAPPASGVGSSEYLTLPGLMSLLVSMKYATGLIVVTRDCSARKLFGPGAPFLSTMPSDSRLVTCCPCFGTYVAYRLS